MSSPINVLESVWSVTDIWINIEHAVARSGGVEGKAGSGGQKN